MTAAPKRPTAAGHDLVVSRIFEAPVALVYRMWSASEHVARWWGPAGFTAPVCEFEPRVGAPWRIDMRAADGTVYPCRGEFLEVVENERIVFSDIVPEGESAWQADPPPNCVQIITFEDLGGRTRLTVTMRMATEAERAAMAQQGVESGWQSSLERLADMLSETHTEN